MREEDLFARARGTKSTSAYRALRTKQNGDGHARRIYRAACGRRRKSVWEVVLSVWSPVSRVSEIV